MESSPGLDAKLKAVADTQRRQILGLLAQADQDVGDLSRRCGLGQPTISHHLRVLREAGLAGMRREGRHHDYFLLAAGVAEIQQWLTQLRLQRSQPEWNREAYREQVLRAFLEDPGRLPGHPRRRQIVLEWFHSLLERGQLLTLEQVEHAWARHCPRWREVLDELLESGRLLRQGDYILLSD
jgi:DNA-binding transcriptional ArsR family regulator